MTSTQTGKEGAVSAAVEALRKAMIAADQSGLEKLTMAELSYGHSSGKLENKAEFIEALTSGKSGFSAIELSGQTVSVVDKVVDRRGTRVVAQAYLEFLYSPAGQEIIARHHYRPRLKEVFARHAGEFPKVTLFTIDAVFGGWRKAHLIHFAEGGIFDQIYQPR